MGTGVRWGVLDLETQNTFSEVGKNKLHELRISVAGYYDSAADQYFCFEEKELHQLEDRLRKIDLLIGFNIKNFDLPVLRPYLAMAVTELATLDILEEIKNVRGHRVTLQSVATATLNQAKSGSGHDAVRLFREGKMEALKKYCLDDVRITRAIFEYGRRNAKVFFKSERDYQVYEIPVSWEEKLAALPQKNNAFPTSLF
jgi:DEAD/DEAH box helicase domain-containing protein